jgi:hypothetical protein
MKKIYSSLFLLFSICQSQSQTVFTDNFNTSQGTAYSVTNGAIGTSTIWNMNRSGVDMGSRIDNNILDCTNDGSATANVNGWVFANTSTAAFSSPYNTTLNLNPTTVTWTFNMRQIRTDPSGFGSANYGVAFILGGSSNNPSTASTGYAVALGQSLATDPVRLIKYNNGLQGAIADIIVSNTTGLTDFGANYLSIKVTYTPSSDTWELFVRNDGLTAFADPSVGVLTSQGTAVDNTFTGQNLGFLGGYWQGATAATQTAFFDNINVSLASTNSTASDIIANSSFTTPSNINYALYQGNALILANSIEVAGFTIRDGGAAADADAVGTTLTDISFSLTNSANIRKVTLMDGATQLMEVFSAATVNFTGLSLTAPDDGSKNFTIRITFANNVTDNQQFQFAVTSTTAAFAGSQFAATNAGGASSSIVSDNNRVEVIADGLSYLTNTFSPTGNGVAMAPAVQVGSTDTLNFSGNLYTNLDLDFTEQISITSTGTLTGSPVIVTAVAGIANFASLIHTVNGTAFTLNAERTTTLDWDATSNPFDIINSSNSTDYFRSVQNGNWSNPTTWESSVDNLTWQASTLFPTTLASLVTIQSTDTVTITQNADASDVVIESDGMLIQNNNAVFTLDGIATFNSMQIEPQGTFAINGRMPITNGRIEVAGAGRILVQSNPAPNESDDFAYGLANVLFNNTSIYEWATTSTPQWSGRTYFNANSNAYFKFTATPSFALGGASPTIINGVLQADSAIAITGTGTKTFVNGIVNNAIINAIPTSGAFIINGFTGTLDGIGTIILPTAGLFVGDGLASIISVQNNKTLQGDVSFLNNTKIAIFDFDLTITGAITGTNNNSYFLTFGLTDDGKLVRPNIGVTPVEFAVGNVFGTYNPVTISNGDNLNYGVKVYNNILPVPVFDNNNLVNRTWVIRPSGTPAVPVTVTFNYGAGDGNPGFNFASNVEVGLYTSVWNVIATNITPSGTYNVTTNVSSFGAGIDAPMVIGNLGAILAQSNKINLNVKTINNSNELTWQVLGLSNVKYYLVEKSTNGINFTSLPAINNLITKYIDNNPLSGNNYYRLKCVMQNNAIVYSNVVAVRNFSLSLQLYPTIVSNDNLNLLIYSNSNQKINIIVTDILGKNIQHNNNLLKIGSNKLNIPIQNFSKGFYNVSIQFENNEIITKRFLKD